MPKIDENILKAIEHNFQGYFSRAEFLNSSNVALLDSGDIPVALLHFKGNFILSSVFYDESVYLLCIPTMIPTEDENILLAKGFAAFCLNDALVHMIETRGHFDLKRLHTIYTVRQENNHLFYNFSILNDIELYHNPYNHNFYYSYTKKMVLDNSNKFRPVLFLDISLKQKNYSIILSPELSKAANPSTFSGNNADRYFLTFEELFEDGVALDDLKNVVDLEWSYDIFFYYIDAVLKNRRLVDTIFNSCSNYEDMMNLVEVNLI